MTHCADRGRRQLAGRELPRRLKLLLVTGLVFTGTLIAGAALLGSPAPADPLPWARLNTQDVHTLSFADSANDLLFGHHDGVLKSVDGGRTWQPLAARADAMSMAADGLSIVIAGHYVFQESTDGGRSWSEIPADLPDLDIHAFARGIADPARMWAYLAEGGVYESTDGGRRWRKVHDEHILHLTAVLADGQDALLGLHPFSGLVRSDDGGRSWPLLSEPPLAPVTALASTPSGDVVLLGGPRGLFRSDDGGSSWQQILDRGTVLAVAVTADGQTLAAVTSDTAFYRSDDGGMSWPGP